MRYDIAIVGGGFGGTILARALNQRQLRVVLFERNRHPRFALGESTTPLANFALERLAARYDLEDLHQLATYGRWQRHHPNLRRGLKRGFSFFWHTPGEPFDVSDEEARLLVAASPDETLADSHWLRADVDHFLLQRAAAEGVEVFQGSPVERVEVGPRQVALHARVSGTRRRVVAEHLVDAGGPGGVLAQALEAPERPSSQVLGGLSTTLLYTHLEGGKTFTETVAQAGVSLPPGPYPDDRAAIHHLLAEGWIYALPFDHGVTSVGAVLRPDLDPELAQRAVVEPEATWRELLDRYPTLAAQWASAEPLRPLTAVSGLPYRVDPVDAPRAHWLPHGLAFFDPLFSTGIAWTLLAVERLAMLFTGEHGDLATHRLLCRQETDQVEALVEAAHRSLLDRELFAAVARLYFATVSHAEARQRLTPIAPGGSTGAWEGFLGAGDGRLRSLFRSTAESLRDMMGTASSQKERARCLRELRDRIRPYDVVGLDDPRYRQQVPVDLEVLVERAHLLGLSKREVLAALPRLRGEPTAG